MRAFSSQPVFSENRPVQICGWTFLDGIANYATAQDPLKSIGNNSNRQMCKDSYKTSIVLLPYDGNDTKCYTPGPPNQSGVLGKCDPKKQNGLPLSAKKKTI